MPDHLIACVLGGTAPRARTELHDVAFAVGPSVQAVHHQLLDQWFGSPQGLHVDAWVILDSIAGFRIQLSPGPAPNGLHLYFINIGGYRPGEFGERHAWGFFGAWDKATAKARAKATLLAGHQQLHKDDIHDIDDCLQIDVIGGRHIQLSPDENAQAPSVTSGYFPVPAATIRQWEAARTSF